jgi:hypothetical protein
MIDLSNNLINGLSEDELFEIIKNQPDFDCLPLPARWFKKYNIPPREATDFSSFVKSNYTMRCAIAPKDLPALILKEPFKDLSGNVRLVEPAPLEELDVKVISRPYNINDEDRPAIEDLLKEVN